MRSLTLSVFAGFLALGLAGCGDQATFADGRPSGPPEDVLTGFLDTNGHAFGRPVGVAVDRAGALLVADDVGKAIWRVTPATAVSAAAQH